jgi:hypothetical protein
VRFDVQGSQFSRGEPGTGNSGEIGQLPVIRRPPAERLEDGQRPVEEPMLGRNELDIDAVACQFPESDRGLETCDASTDDKRSIAL